MEFINCPNCKGKYTQCRCSYEMAMSAHRKHKRMLTKRRKPKALTEDEFAELIGGPAPRCYFDAITKAGYIIVEGRKNGAK